LRDRRATRDSENTHTERLGSPLPLAARPCGQHPVRAARAGAVMCAGARMRRVSGRRFSDRISLELFVVRYEMFPFHSQYTTSVKRDSRAPQDLYYTESRLAVSRANGGDTDPPAKSTAVAGGRHRLLMLAIVTTFSSFTLTHSAGSASLASSSTCSRSASSS
jgi:hypothetical protein